MKYEGMTLMDDTSENRIVVLLRIRRCRNLPKNPYLVAMNSRLRSIACDLAMVIRHKTIKIFAQINFSKGSLTHKFIVMTKVASTG